MRVLSWNVLKKDGASAADIAGLAREHAPDLLLLQEARACIDTLPGLLGGHYVRRAMQGRNHGPAAWSPLPFESLPVPLPTATRFDLPVPILRSIAPRLALLVRLGALTVATIHLDHGQRTNRRQLRSLPARYPGLDMVIGDTNALGRFSLPGFEDVGPACATHRAYGVLPLRLDRCLVRGLKRTEARALAFGPSDHRPILVTFA